MEKAIKEKSFPEVIELNRGLRKVDVAASDLFIFVLASRKPRLDFWLIDEFGNFSQAG